MCSSINQIAMGAGWKVVVYMQGRHLSTLTRVSQGVLYTTVVPTGLAAWKGLRNTL